MQLIDVHTHIMSHPFIDLLQKYGAPQYTLTTDSEGKTIINRDGARFLTFFPPMFEPEVRLEEMDAAGVEIGLISYSCPNCYWAKADVAARVARVMNEHIAEVCARWPDRFKGLASIPLQDVDLALNELEWAIDNCGMVGLIILANVNNIPLDDPSFEPIWNELDRRRLPTFMHPTTPPGLKDMGMEDYGMIASIGFMIDTTLSVTRMAYGGVFERNPNWPLIVPHTGATLPYIAGRLDQCYRFIPDARSKAPKPPSQYLKRLYYDTVCYDVKALKLAYDFAGPERLIFGSDYPHNIGDMEGCASRIAQLEISEDEKSLICNGNAKRLFSI